MADIAADSAAADKISTVVQGLKERVAKDALTDDDVEQAGAAAGSEAAALLVQAYGLWALRPPGFTTLVKGALLGGAAPHALAALLGQMLGGIRGQGVIPRA